MKVLGYTSEKELVAVDLSVDEIVARGIDPWRLDLFDPNPISLEVSGKLVHFRALEDVAFFDTRGMKSSTWVVGISDQAGKICLLQDPNHMPFQPEGSTKVSDKSFEVHFRQYLAGLETSLQESVMFEIPASRLVLDQKSGLDPKETFRLADFSPLYVGEMCAELEIPYQLPDELNFVFHRFGKWNPIILEHCLIDVMLSRPINRVYFLMDSDGVEELINSPDLSPDLNVSTNFGWTNVTVGDCMYTVDAKDDLPNGGVGVAKWSSQWREGRHSLRCFYSSAENRISGLRIAFNDIANMQTRRLFSASNYPASPRAHISHEEKQRDDRDLAEAGFKIIDGAAILSCAESTVAEGPGGGTP